MLGVIIAQQPSHVADAAQPRLISTLDSFLGSLSTHAVYRSHSKLEISDTLDIMFERHSAEVLCVTFTAFVLSILLSSFVFFG